MKYFKMAKQFFLDNPKAAVGIFLVATVVLMCVFAPLLTDVLPGARVGRPHQAPSTKPRQYSRYDAYGA